MNLDGIPKIDGEVRLDKASKILYATDASAYKEMPLGVAFPKHDEDLRQIILWAHTHGIALIPRAAGTSLAGQVVGNGLVVDISRHFRQIIEVNAPSESVRVQAGVIRDNLNLELKKYRLFFGPETSTSNRCMIGGMLGNNSCGARSIVYGSVRDQIISVKGFFSNGEFAHIKALNKKEFLERVASPQASTYNMVLTQIHQILESPERRELIHQVFPKASISRRNTGYAIDILAKSNVYVEGGPDFNLCHLLAGSEGTLFFSTEIELNCHPLPPKHEALLCVHSTTIRKSLEANLKAIEFKPSACELMDSHILNCTKNHPHFSKYRFFVNGDPAAILVVELAEHSKEKLKLKLDALKHQLLDSKLAYYCSEVHGSEAINQVWLLRKAGLGLLSNIPGDAKPAPVIEDTAVDVYDLPDFIDEFNKSLIPHNLSCVHYAHAATGELHLRPIINLKTEEGRKLFRATATDIAQLVKKYKGSLSGEHGDGRLRGEFISFMYGPKVYNWFCEIKKAFDPKQIFNPGKITNTPPMDQNLRYDQPYHTEERNTFFDWSAFHGYQRTVELCNGSGDCRKSVESGGVMCPSYMASLEEKHSTRGRANLLRDFLSTSENHNWNNKDVNDALDLCLSCKACKSECPSNVDMAKIKAEYLAQGQHFSFRSKAFGNSSLVHEKMAHMPRLYNIFNHGFIARLSKVVLGIAQQRTLPKMVPFKNCQKKNSGEGIVLLSDEFNHWLNGPLIECILSLCRKLDISVRDVIYFNSARAQISKGLIPSAKKTLQKQEEKLKTIPKDAVIVGIEPSAILGFRDEFPSLFPKSELWLQLKDRVLLAEEYFYDVFTSKPDLKQRFKKDVKQIHYHGHCHQKTLSNNQIALNLLACIPSYEIKEIKSTCCGMAGSFGYEKEHYSISKSIAELALIPQIKAAPEHALISASGFSCQHQIQDFAGKRAFHPIEILEQAIP